LIDLLIDLFIYLFIEHRGYLPGRIVSPPLDLYQIILLGDRGHGM